MLLIAFAGRLYTAKAFAFQERSRFTGRVSWVPGARWMPSIVVSRGAVKVKFEIGRTVRERLRNRNRLFDWNGFASDTRSDRLFVYVWRRSGLPAVSDSGFELSTTFCSWPIDGGPVNVF